MCSKSRIIKKINLHDTALYRNYAVLHFLKLVNFFCYILILKVLLLHNYFDINTSVKLYISGVYVFIIPVRWLVFKNK